MRTAFFSNHFAAKSAHGVATYSRNLVRELNALDDVAITPVATWSDLSESDLAERVQESGLRVLPWGRKITPIAWTFLNHPPVEHWLNSTTDLVHLSALGFPVSTRLPLVATVHDLGPLTHPELFSIAPPWLLRRNLQQVIRQAAALICVSQATADQLVMYTQEHYAVDVSPRVEVIHEGVEASFFEPVDEDCLKDLAGYTGERPFLMMAGAISPRKNVHGVLRALEQVADKIEHDLVVVGGGGWDTEVVQDQLRNSGLQDRVRLLGYVTQQQLQSLYGRATAFLYPSLFEGFGLTILEAMAAGCPVITSNVFSLPEVAGDAAILVDPHDSHAIGQAIVKLCDDTTHADELRQQGRERAESFTWSKCAAQTHDIYQRVLRNS